MDAHPGGLGGVGKASGYNAATQGMVPVEEVERQLQESEARWAERHSMPTICRKTGSFSPHLTLAAVGCGLSHRKAWQALVDDGRDYALIMEDDLSAAVAELEPASDFILIDCPGSHTRLSQVAHSLADTLITPMNDSFVDFDLLAHIDNEGENIVGPSVYAEMVWNARQLRAQAGRQPIDWVVLRNRVGSQRMLNKQKMEKALHKLAKRIGFRVAPGFNERVVFRELFPRGLTLLDLKDIGVKHLNISNIAARQELRDLIKALNLPEVSVDF